MKLSEKLMFCVSTVAAAASMLTVVTMLNNFFRPEIFNIVAFIVEPFLIFVGILAFGLTQKLFKKADEIHRALKSSPA
jgi:hypothetical protein